MLAVAVLAVSVGLGVSPVIAPFALLPWAVVAADAFLLVFWRPPVALAFAVVVPFLTTLPRQSLLTVGALAMLFIAIARSWQSAGHAARRGALLVSLLGLTSLLIGVGLSTAGPQTAAIVRAVVYGTVTGVASALVRPSARAVAMILALLADVIALLALANPELSVDRTTVIAGENANGVGLVVAIGLVAALTLTRRSSKAIAVLGTASAILCGTAIVASGSRGALLAAIAGGIVLVLRRFVRGHPVQAALTVVAVTTCLYFASGPANSLFLEASGRSVANTEETLRAAYNIRARQASVRYAIDQGLAHPVFGVGLGQLEEVSRTDPRSRLGLSSHNVFLGLFAESGVLAFAALLAVSVVALRNARRHSVRELFPLVVTVLVGGLSLGWWGASRLGPMVLLVLGAALGLPGPVQDHDGGALTRPGIGEEEVAAPAGSWRAMVS